MRETEGDPGRVAAGAHEGAAPDLSVIIPTYERRELVLRALGALAAQTLPRDRYEVVVVCDGGTDGTAEAARTFRMEHLAPGAPAPAPSAPLPSPASSAPPPPGPGPGRARAPARAAGLSMIVLEQPNAGAAAARNRGARAARAPLLLFLDDDMMAAPDLLEVHRDRHARSPGGIVIGAIPVDPSSPCSFLAAGLAAWADRRHARLSAPGAAVPPGDVLTGQISLARATFEALSGFDPRFTAAGTFGGEDVELGWRARRQEIPILYEPRAVSRQVYEKTFRALARDVRQAGAADVRLARLHPEIEPELMLGRLDALSPWPRRAARLTLASPSLASALHAPLLAALDVAARRGLTGRLLENLHGVARAHLYALGMTDAGYREAAR